MAENSPIRRTRPTPRKHPYQKPALGISGLNNKTKQPQLSTRSPLKNINQASAGTLPKTSFLQSLKDKSKVNSIEVFPNIKKDEADSISMPSYKLFPTAGETEAAKNARNVQINEGKDQVMDDILKSLSYESVPIISNSTRFPPTPGKNLEFGVIGDRRTSNSNGNNSLGFIQIDKSCSIAGGNEILEMSSASANMSMSSLNTSSSSIVEFEVGRREKEEAMNCSWNPFDSVDVTSGILGQFQPRSLNSSFMEKFESRLGIDSQPKENLNTSQTSNKNNAHNNSRGILTARSSPFYQCPDYSNEIMNYLMEVERKFKVKYDYMERHKEISHKMRTILLDWLSEVVDEYELGTETLHLTANYIDRFLCKMNVRRTKLQLVGVSALLIAAKFDECNPPEISDYVYVADEAYSKEEIIAMEKCMLQTLEFDLMIPTAHTFASSFCSLMELSDPIRNLSFYLVDLSLLEGGLFLQFLPSVVAGAAVALARFSFDHIYYDKKLAGICQHRKITLTPCVRHLHGMFLSAGDRAQQSFYEKYQSVRYCQVAIAFIPSSGPWDQN